MLTEYDLQQFERYIDKEGRLSNIATERLIEEVRTLQQQNTDLKSALEGLIDLMDLTGQLKPTKEYQVAVSVLRPSKAVKHHDPRDH